jgi:hypothetical protein
MSSDRSGRESLRKYAEVQKDFRDAFADLAKECEGFVGHSQTFRSWFGLLVSRFGFENLDAGFKMLIHMDLSVSKDADLTPKFLEFLDALKKIRSLHDELEGLQTQDIRPDIPMVTA